MCGLEDVLTNLCRDPLATKGGVECSDLPNNVASFEDGYAQICKLTPSSIYLPLY